MTGNDHPLSRTHLGARLDRAAWLAASRASLSTLQHRYFQLERLQSYAEPENPSLQAFRTGNRDDAAHLMEDAVARDEPLYVLLCQKGIPYVRAHAVERPLTTYLEWELEVYRVLARYGQRVLVLDLTHEPALSEFRRSYDFLLFDERLVMVQDYDATGLLVGGWASEDPAVVSAFATLAREIQLRSVPLATFERRLGTQNP